MGVAEWKTEAPESRSHSREGDGNPRMCIKINYRKYIINIHSHRRPQGDSYVKLISLYLILSHLLCTVKSPNYWYRAHVLSHFSCVWLFATPWMVICQAPLSMGFPRQGYWSGLPFPPPGDLPDPGIEPMSPALSGGFFTTEPPRKTLGCGRVFWRPCSACPENSPSQLCSALIQTFPGYFPSSSELWWLDSCGLLGKGKTITG